MQQNLHHINTTNNSKEAKDSNSPDSNATLKLAIIGSRGYPYVYSGYETLVKALVERLPAKGVERSLCIVMHIYFLKNRHMSMAFVWSISQHFLLNP